MEHEFQDYNFFKTLPEIKAQTKISLKDDRAKGLWANFILSLFKFLNVFSFLGLIFVLLVKFLNAFMLNSKLLNILTFFKGDLYYNYINATSSISANFLKPLILFLILTIVTYILKACFNLGVAKLTQNIALNLNPKFSNVFYGFSHFGQSLGYALNRTIRMFFLLLPITVPYFFMLPAYSLSIFIVADDSKAKISQAFTDSAKFTKGHRTMIAKFYLKRFWFIPALWLLAILAYLVSIYWLCALVILGITITNLWLKPYLKTSLYHIYIDLKE